VLRPSQEVPAELTLSLSLSLSGCACVHVPLSFFLSLSLLFYFICFSLSLSFSMTHTHTHTVTRSLSFTHLHLYICAESLSQSFSHPHTHFFLSIPLFSCFSLSYIHTCTHTLRTHTLYNFFSRPPPHSFVSRVSAALSSSNVCDYTLSSLFLSPFYPFLFFSSAILCPCLSSSALARFLARCLSCTCSIPLVFNSW